MVKVEQIEVGRIYLVHMPKIKYWGNLMIEKDFVGKVIQICDNHITFVRESTVRESFEKWDLAFAKIIELGELSEELEEELIA